MPGRRGLGAVALLSVAVGTALLAGALKPRESRVKSVALGPEAPVTATDQLSMPANNSPLLVADPTDDRLIIVANRLDAPDFGCALNVSRDGGRHWLPADPVPVLPPGAEKCYGPEVAFDHRGTLYFLFVGLHTRGNLPMGVFIATSFDRGATFTSPRQVLGPLNFGVRMAIDPSIGDLGRLHLVWIHTRSDPPLGGFPDGPNPIMAAHSDDGGASFSEPVQVSDSGPMRVVAPALALGADHAVHVGYYDLGADVRDYQGLAGPLWDGTWSVVVATSLDGGLHFERGMIVDHDVAPAERPMLIFTMAPPALTAGPGRVCAAWADARHGDADVLARCSGIDGRRWGPLRRVNDDAFGNGIRQYLPRLSIAPGGRIDAVYLDRRHNPTNSVNDVSYTYSTDGGRSFTPSRRLTEASWSPRIGQRYAGPAAAGQVEIGGRLGLLSRRSEAVVAWPDTRYPALAPSPMGQDVFARHVRFASGDGGGWARGMGGALVGAGAVLAVAARRRRGPGPVEPPAGATPLVVEEEEEDSPRRSQPLVTVGLAMALGLFTVVGLPRWQSRTGPQRPVVSAQNGGVQVVDVAMSEYRFTYRPPVDPGRTVFRVRNAGREDHVFGLYLVPDNLPPIDVQLHGDQRRSVDSPVELPISRPGQVQTVAVDLVPRQRYALLCFLGTRPGSPIHALSGMSSEFRIA